MFKTFCLIALLGTGLAQVSSIQAATVLFIGNSFTIGGTKPVPTIFDALAQAGGQGDPMVVMRAVGGQDFEYHDTNSVSQINSQQWTHVVLQNYSTQPTHLSSGGTVAEHYQYGKLLYDKIMANNAATQVVLYETWSRSAAHSLITGISTPSSFASTAEFQSELRTNYYGLAASLNQANPTKPPVVVAPVGDAWENAGGLLPASDPRFVDLFGSDEYHGNDNGYYLAAAVFYAQIYGVSPEGLSTRPEITALKLNLTGDPAHLERTAWQTVQSVPEPSTAGLICLGGLALGMRRGRSWQK